MFPTTTLMRGSSTRVSIPPRPSRSTQKRHARRKGSLPRVSLIRTYVRRVAARSQQPRSIAPKERRQVPCTHPRRESAAQTADSVDRSARRDVQAPHATIGVVLSTCVLQQTDPLRPRAQRGAIARGVRSGVALVGTLGLGAGPPCHELAPSVFLVMLPTTSTRNRVGRSAEKRRRG